ncbi:cohesin domain-containing protein [Chloroflexota bacterium]
MKKVCLAVALAVAMPTLVGVMLPAATLAQAGTADVVLPDLDVMPGDILTIDITVANINASMGLAACDFTLQWDPQVIEITNILGGENPWHDPPIYNAAKLPTGWVAFSSVQTSYYPGLQTDQVIARIVATAVGAPSDNTVLDLEPGPFGSGVSLTDADGNTITPTFSDGSVHIVSMGAAHILTVGIDAGHYAVISPGIKHASSPHIDADITLSYDGMAINVMGVAGVAPSDSPAVKIDNTQGITTISQTRTGTAPQTPTIFADVRIKLLGTVDTPCNLTLSYTSITDSDTGSTLTLDGTLVETLLRGDAKPDGDVDIADVLFVAQHLAGVRGTGQGLDYCHPINAASVKHDGNNGDQITTDDYVFIAQYLAGTHNANFGYTD